MTTLETESLRLSLYFLFLLKLKQFYAILVIVFNSVRKKSLKIMEWKVWKVHFPKSASVSLLLLEIAEIGIERFRKSKNWELFGKHTWTGFLPVVFWYVKKLNQCGSRRLVSLTQSSSFIAPHTSDMWSVSVSGAGRQDRFTGESYTPGLSSPEKLLDLRPQIIQTRQIRGQNNNKSWSKIQC